MAGKQGSGFKAKGKGITLIRMNIPLPYAMRPGPIVKPYILYRAPYTIEFLTNTNSIAVNFF
jgi:hypothetical protein